MVDRVVDISAGNELLSTDTTHFVLPRSHGFYETLATAVVDVLGNDSRNIYPSARQWGQFAMFFNDVEGILVYVKSYDEPEISRWVIDKTAMTLTVTFADTRPSGNAPELTVEYINSTDWRDGADIYKEWVQNAPWYPTRKHIFVNWCQTGSTNAGNTLRDTALAMLNVYPEGVISFVSNYRTSPFDTLYPDSTINTAANFDTAFTTMRDAGIKVFPYISGLFWDKDEGGYDIKNMVWVSPVDITTITNTAGTSYDFVLSANPNPHDDDITTGDHFAVTGSGNANLDSVQFEVTAVTDNTHFTCSGPDTGGNAATGSCHWVAKWANAASNLKLCCTSVDVVRDRFAMERASLKDSTGRLTEGVYVDTAAATRPYFCFNPHHNHPVGDGSYWVPSVKKLTNAVRQGGLLMTEGFAEPLLRHANIFLYYGNTGDNKYSGLIPLFEHIYGNVCHVGWRELGGPTDQTISSRIDDAIDNFGVGAHGSPFQSATPENSIFNGTHAITLANLQERGSYSNIKVPVIGNSISSLKFR